MVNKNRVLVTAVGGNVGQGVVKSLRAGEINYYIIGIDMESLSAGFSFVDSYYKVSKTGSQFYKDELVDIIIKENIQSIYVCSPTELDFFSLNQKEIEDEFGIKIFVNPLNVVQIGSNKLATAKFLEEYGFPFPKTFYATDKNGVDELISEFGFPLIIKPCKGYTSKNVFLVNSIEEINAARTLIPDLIVQRYLPDPSTEFTAGTISGFDKKVYASIVLHREINQGTTYRTELYQNKNINNQVIDITEALGAVGACNLQFRVVDNKVFVFEVNPRFSGTSGIRYLYGFNDPEMVFKLLYLNQKIKQPKLNNAVVLRYWNEIFINNASFKSISKYKMNHNYEIV